MENNTEILEKKLNELSEKNERTNKMLINAEYIFIALMVLIIISASLVSSILISENWIRGIIIGISLFVVLLLALFCWKVETKVGFYQCSKCGHKYVPTYKASLFAVHMGLTRYMKCPECGKKSWQKKVLK